MPENNELDVEESNDKSDTRRTDKVILKHIFSINQTLVMMSKDISEIKAVKVTVDKHEMVIYGDQEKMGEGGIVYTLNNLKREVSLAAAIVAASVSAVFTIIITVLSKKI